MVDAPKISRRGVSIMVYWVVAAIVILLDQATKAAVRVAAPSVGRMGTLVPGLLDLVHTENSGAAFSIGQGAGWLFVAIAAVVIAITFVYVCTNNLPLDLTISLACVAGGGAGNMVDRVMHGTVTDFIATTFMDFPVFNVADIFVTCGVLACFVCYLRWDAAQSKNGTTTEE